MLRRFRRWVSPARSSSMSRTETSSSWASPYVSIVLDCSSPSPTSRHEECPLTCSQGMGARRTEPFRQRRRLRHPRPSCRQRPAWARLGGGSGGCRCPPAVGALTTCASSAWRVVDRMYSCRVATCAAVKGASPRPMGSAPCVGSPFPRRTASLSAELARMPEAGAAVRRRSEAAVTGPGAPEEAARRRDPWPLVWRGGGAGYG